MAPAKWRFTRSQAPEHISEQAWRSLRITYLMTIIHLGVMCLFGITVFAGLFIPRQVEDMAAVIALALMLLSSVLTLLLGLWSLRLRLRESFKIGNILIAGAIGYGAGTAGVLLLIGFIFLATR